VGYGPRPTRLEKDPRYVRSHAPQVQLKGVIRESGVTARQTTSQVRLWPADDAVLAQATMALRRSRLLAWTEEDARIASTAIRR
jgi:hypothetical protein